MEDHSTFVSSEPTEIQRRLACSLATCLYSRWPTSSFVVSCELQYDIWYTQQNWFAFINIPPQQKNSTNSTNERIIYLLSVKIKYMTKDLNHWATVYKINNISLRSTYKHYCDRTQRWLLLLMSSCKSEGQFDWDSDVAGTNSCDAVNYRVLSNYNSLQSGKSNTSMKWPQRQLFYSLLFPHTHTHTQKKLLKVERLRSYCTRSL